MSYYHSVLFSAGWHNKIPKTEWLKQRTLISHSSMGWEVQEEAAGQFSY